MKSPKHLSHKPIISVNDYDEIDGMYANRTDVQALSIGKAQYDVEQISLKVWRHTGEKWSRQSEELPIHRNLDLSILLLSALSIDPSVNYPISNLPLEIDKPNEVQIIKDYYTKHRKDIEPRLKQLKQLLNEFVK
jgi:hypothetical protein